MRQKQLLQKLEELIKNAEIDLKYEKKYLGKGGFCKYNDSKGQEIKESNEKKVIILNYFLPLESKINLLVEELSKVNLENISVPLEIKKILEKKIAMQK